MKIVTTVGTSLITNQLEDDNIKALYNVLKQKNYCEKKDFEKEYDKLKEILLKNVSLDEKTSAEIKSIIKIKDIYKNQYFEIELIATDTILSPICAEVLQILFDKDDLKINFDDKNIIKDLQVSNYELYKKGLINLLNRLSQIANNGTYFSDLTLNITGGFKGVIPYLTIFSQVNNIPLFYIFEFTNTLIEIPQIPIKIDEYIFDKYWKEFYMLNKNYILNKKDLTSNFLKANHNILEMEGDFISFNALGKILWDKYASAHFIFYTNDEVLNDIEKQIEIKRILSSKFKANFDSKTERKGEHLVYDDGNNPNRIFYFIDDEEFYIYKTFQHHDDYEKYINSNSLDKKKFIKDSKIRKLSF